MACEDEPISPDPYNVAGQEWLRVDNGNTMLATLRAFPGSETAPGIANKEDPRDGLYFLENKIGFSIDGLNRLLLENDGLTLKISAFTGKFTHANTGNRTYTLPDHSGTVFVGTFAEEDPDNLDDLGQGYPVGYLWVNTLTGTIWTSVDDTDDAAVWESTGNGSGTILELENENASPIVIGAPVYLSGESLCDLAQADDITTSRAIGLVADTSIASATIGNVQTAGLLEATTTQWDAITGDTGGLIPNLLYYVSVDNVGKLVRTSPKVLGDPLCRVGQAISPTQMNIKIEFLGRR